MDEYRSFSNIDFVLKLCNLEVIKYTFFSFSKKSLKEMVKKFEQRIFF